MFRKFPKIRGFHNIVKEVRAFPKEDGTFPSVDFRPKIKLHGSNAGIRVYPDGSVVAQKRSGDCGPSGHFNFPVWVKGNESYFSSLKDDTYTYIFYGEWAGKGIQKKVAVSNIDKSFFVFSVSKIEGEGEDAKITRIIEPNDIKFIMGDLPENTYILPWYANTISIDFNSQSELEELAKKFNSDIDDIDKCDPYIKEIFNIDGCGEGLVYYPVHEDMSSRGFSRYAFKVKGDSHSKSDGAGKEARVKAPIPQSAYNFVDMMLTEDRLTQGVMEICPDSVDIKKTGAYIGWVCKDVVEEGADELLAANLEWSQVQGMVATRARVFFMEKVKEF